MRAAAQIPEDQLNSIDGVEARCPDCGHLMDGSIYADENTVRLTIACPMGCPFDEDVSYNPTVTISNDADLLREMEPPSDDGLYAESAWPTRQEECTCTWEDGKRFEQPWGCKKHS